MERDGPEDQGEIDRCIARHMASHGDANSKRKAFNLLQQSGAAKPSHLRAFLGEAWCWKALPAQVCTDWVVTNSSNRFGESHGRGGSASCSDNLSRFTELVHAAATDNYDDDDDDDNHDDDDDDDYDDDDDNHDDDVPGRPPILLLQEICGRVTMDQGETCHPEVADMGATGLG